MKLKNLLSLVFPEASNTSAPDARKTETRSGIRVTRGESDIAGQARPIFSSPRVAFEFFQKRRAALALPVVGLIEADIHPFDRPDRSRVGGSPALLRGETWPEDDRAGGRLTFLAQINLADMPRSTSCRPQACCRSLSARAMISAVTSPSRPLQYRQKGYLIRILPADSDLVIPPDPPISDSIVPPPFQSPRIVALKGVASTMQPNLSCDLELYEDRDMAAARRRFTGDDISRAERDIYEEALRFPLDKDGGNLHFDLYLGGYPDYVQDDIRVYEDDLAALRSLFVCGSWNDLLMWGDVGIASFLVDPEKSREGDVSGAIYYWDS